MKESFQNRLRFTIAHEIGHFILHEKVHEGVQFSTVEEWAEFMPIAWQHFCRRQYFHSKIALLSSPKQ